MSICATVSRDLPADPDALFETLVNPHRLPEWNKAITTVIDGPETLAPGDESVVEMAALAQRWQSRSQVKVLNALPGASSTHRRVTTATLRTPSGAGLFRKPAVAAGFQCRGN